MGKKEFYKLWLAKTFIKPLAFVDLFSGILAIGFGAIIFFQPRWGGTLNNLLWIVPFMVLIGTVIVGFFLAPYFIYKEKADKVLAYETQAVELVPSTVYLSRRQIWVARVGVRALGQKVIRGVVLYLRAYDGNENSFSDAPLCPSDRLRNVSGAININPGTTMRFFEVLHWNPVTPEMGIPYNLNYQLEQAGVNIHSSPFSLPTGIALSDHTLSVYATGEDIKPAELEFKVGIRNDKLEILTPESISDRANSQT